VSTKAVCRRNGRNDWKFKETPAEKGEYKTQGAGATDWAFAYIMELSWKSAMKRNILLENHSGREEEERKEKAVLLREKEFTTTVLESYMKVHEASVILSAGAGSASGRPKQFNLYAPPGWLRDGLGSERKNKKRGEKKKKKKEKYKKKKKHHKIEVATP